MHMLSWPPKYATDPFVWVRCYTLLRRKNHIYSKQNILEASSFSLSIFYDVLRLRPARQDPNTDLLSRPGSGESALRNDLHSISLVGFHACNLVAVRKPSLCAG